MIELADVADPPLLGESTAATDPQEVYDRWRRQWGQVVPVVIEPGVPAWLVLGYHDTVRIMRDERLWSRDPRNWRLNREDLIPQGAGIRAFSPPEPRGGSYHHDGPVRARLRRALDDAFTELPEADVKAAARRVCTAMIETFEAPSQVDLVAEYASRVGFLTTASMLGVEGKPAMQLMADSETISRHRPGALEARSRIGATLLQHV